MWLKAAGRRVWQMKKYIDGGKKEGGYDLGVESSLTRIIKCQRTHRNRGTFT